MAIGVEYADRINSDADCKSIFDRLIRRGVEERAVLAFQKGLLTISDEWEIIKNEAVEDRRERREKLASKIKQLADEINGDADAKLIRLYDEKSIFTGVMPDKPLVSDFLLDFAEHINTLAISEYREQYETSRPANKSPKNPDVIQYAMRRVFQMLKSINTTSHGQNKDTATLVNVLFDLNDEMKVKANDITQMRNKERRKYYTEKK